MRPTNSKELWFLEKGKSDFFKSMALESSTML